MRTELALTTTHDDVMLSMGFAEGESIKPVNLTLTQPIAASAEDGTIAGRFCDSQSNMQFENLDVVILKITKGRVLFPPGGYQAGAKPVCRSNDGIMPVVDDQLIRQDDGKGCAKCPQSAWKVIAGRKIRPACNDTRVILLAELTTGFTYRYNIKGTAVRPVDDLRETINKYYLRTKAAGKPIFPYQMAFKLSSLRIDGTSGKYYIPKFGPPSVINPDQAADMLELYKNLVINKRADLSGDGVTEDAGTSVDAVSSALEGEYQPMELEAA
jgi:hypothetical protein